jgi:hypothetical protein
MKKLNLKKNYLKIAILIIGIYWTYNYFDNQNQILKLNFGTKSNELRKSLNVPIIDKHMSSKNGYSWESSSENPSENQILHTWKIITPSENENFILNEENDAYRKKESNGRIRQLNIYNKIIKDSILIRTGRIFYHDEPREKLELDETGVNRIVKIWNLNYLIKK